ncbi:sensor histidine kinase [Coleofasciculus sp.]|uniref:sensor histidine kinase n=1 Tax=Coleofasciculus sp. TaxID=3100458 RepID=UPI0039FA5568
MVREDQGNQGHKKPYKFLPKLGIKTRFPISKAKGQNPKLSQGGFRTNVTLNSQKKIPKPASTYSKPCPLSEVKRQNSVSPQFKSLRWRLLGSYLMVMVAIRVISNGVVYEFFAHSLYQQLDNRLLNLAQAAAHSLVAIKQDKDAVDQPAYRPLDGDGDLDIPWQNLSKPDQSVEWFGADQQRLAISGTLSPTFLLQEGFQTGEQGQIRTLTIPAYSYRQGERQLEGYVRASESTESVEAVLSQLRWGSGVAGILAFGLMGVGGMWLTRQSMQPIEQSFQQLKQFTADASHELRSPLTAIKASVEVMQTHPERIHPADVEKLAAIASATSQMSRLVEDLLLLARTDATTAAREWMVIPLDELLEDVEERLEPNAEAQDITLKWLLQPDVFVKGDASQLFRVFCNLLENALQYTPSGGTVTLSMSTDETLVVVSVEDTGIGIDPEHLPFIFDRLWRADKARTQRQEGSGLGLAIAQAVAQQHGGDITVTSELGVGSCFQVYLPIVS